MNTETIMGRPRKEDRGAVAETTLTIRLTVAEKEGLERIVARQQAELQQQFPGVQLSMAGYIRSLIAEKVKAFDAQQQVAPSATTCITHAEPVVEASEPESPEPPQEIDAAALRKRLRKVLMTNLFPSQAEFCRQAGLRPISLTRFKNGKGLEPKALAAIAKTLADHNV